MKKFIALGLAAVVAGCGAPAPKPKPEQTAVNDQPDDVWAQRQDVTYQGNVFEYVYDRKTSSMQILPKTKGFKFTAKDLEAIARAETGCAGTFRAGALAGLNGFAEHLNLGIAKHKGGDVPPWVVDLKC